MVVCMWLSRCGVVDSVLLFVVAADWVGCWEMRLLGVVVGDVVVCSAVVGFMIGPCSLPGGVGCHYVPSS